MTLETLLEKSKKYIQKKIKYIPDFGIILLGYQFNELIEEIKNPIDISYEEIPDLKEKKIYVKFIFGKIEEKKVVFFIPLYSFYEENGNNHFPILLFKKMRVNKLILINISGSVNPNYKIGDIMLVKDHINFFPESYEMKKILENNRFFGITETYDQKMLEIAENIAMNHNIIIQKGVYVAFPYPNYKTTAEYAMIRSIGGDSVGMNIVPYVITAKWMNLRVFSISIMVGLGEEQEHNKKGSYNWMTSLNSIPILILMVKEFIKYYDNFSIIFLVIFSKIFFI
ncbi:MAG: purine-nucleoside phosphorylase [Flavobacteriales bacterium]|jgi:purine-nucleoside phosphorylase|nr:purine-nucleoside phosphorylase [Flavobacteriales bacterium]